MVVQISDIAASTLIGGQSRRIYRHKRHNLNNRYNRARNKLINSTCPKSSDPHVNQNRTNRLLEVETYSLLSELPMSLLTDHKPLFIGLGHYKRTGKDSFADYLIQAVVNKRAGIKITKQSLAWKLKQVCFELYAWAGLREPEYYETKVGAEFREVILPKLGKSPRGVWIDFGTKAVRDHVYERTWLDYLVQSKSEHDVVIVPDVRFDNEFEELQKAGAILIKVIRPGFSPGPNRPDRQLLNRTDWSNVIGTSGEMSELAYWAGLYANWITGGDPVVRDPEAIIHALRLEAGYVEPWDGND